MLRLSFTLQQLITLVNYFNYSQGNGPGTDEEPTGLHRHGQSAEVRVYPKEPRFRTSHQPAWDNAGGAKREQGNIFGEICNFL